MKFPAINSYKVQNMQSEKMAFLKEANKTSDDYIKSKSHKPFSPYEIKFGTIILATLMTGINSTLPGTIIAKACCDVFDTASRNYLLIPQGTTFDLQGMLGANLTGMTGLQDKVDHHYFRIFGSALLFSPCIIY